MDILMIKEIVNIKLQASNLNHIREFNFVTRGVIVRFKAKHVKCCQLDLLSDVMDPHGKHSCPDTQ